MKGFKTNLSINEITQHKEHQFELRFSNTHAMHSWVCPISLRTYVLIIEGPHLLNLHSFKFQMEKIYLMENQLSFYFMIS